MTISFRIQSDKSIAVKLRRFGARAYMTFTYEPGETIGIINLSVQTGRWYWSRVESADWNGFSNTDCWDGFFDTIEEAVKNFCEKAFDEPITL